jgi:hypothetical protein
LKSSRNPIVGELVRTDHPTLPILEISDPQGGFLTTGKIFPKGNLGILSEVRINMGMLIFTDGTTGWCNLCYLEVVA